MFDFQDLTIEEESEVDELAEVYYEQVFNGKKPNLNEFLNQFQKEYLKQAFIITVNMTLLLRCSGKIEKKGDAEDQSASPSAQLLVNSNN